jgi:hypothetical protein
MVYILGFYAWDLKLHGMKEENFYYQLNKVLQDRQLETILAFQGILQNFIYFIYKLQTESKS